MRPLIEAAVRLRYETNIMGSVQHEGDPRHIFPYVHRGPRADETKEALRASRASHSRFSGKKLIFNTPAQTHTHGTDNYALLAAEAF